MNARIRTCSWLVGLLALAWAGLSAAPADIIYSALAADDSYTVHPDAFYIKGPAYVDDAMGYDWRVAFRFVPAAETQTFRMVEGFVKYGSGTNTLSVALYESSVDTDAILAKDIPIDTTPGWQFFRCVFPGQTTVSWFHDYYLVLTMQGDGQAWVARNDQNEFLFLRRHTRHGTVAGSWSKMTCEKAGAFRISTVPEPAVLSLLGIGGLAALLARPARRRRRPAARPNRAA